MARVKLQNLVKRYGDVVAVDAMNLDIEHNEFVVFVGPSGCGKSTTLRMIAGLEDITGGQLLIDDKVVNNVEPKDRNIAMVFQNYALYPHMTVYKNMAFGLRASKLPKDQISTRVRWAADILGLTDLLERRPNELSGGQRQRVAMGRAIVREPSVFLFDEPLSNLDAKLRAQMRIEIKKLHQKVKTTVIYVTHDQVEAMTLADRIVIMRDGKIQQIGKPTDVYENPANLFVAGFIGSPSMNLIPGTIVLGKNGNEVDVGHGHQLSLPAKFNKAGAGQEVVLGIRPEDFITGADAPGGDYVSLTLPAGVVEPMGNESLVYASIGDVEVIGKSPGREVPDQGSTMTFHCPSGHLYLFDAKTGAALV